MLGALALFMSSVIKQLENFAGVMNFVIFPMFFASSALYPLWRIKEFESAALLEIRRANPFTHCVELIRFALYGQVEQTSLAIVLGFTAVFLTAAIYAYNPSRGCSAGVARQAEDDDMAPSNAVVGMIAASMITARRLSRRKPLVRIGRACSARWQP